MNYSPLDLEAVWCNPEDLPGAMDDRDRWQEREGEGEREVIY